MNNPDEEFEDFEEEESDPEFDPDAPSTKRRELGGPVTFEQHGHRFSAAKAYIGPVESFTPADAKDAIRHKSAKKKLEEKKAFSKTNNLKKKKKVVGSRLKDFKEPDAPDAIELARKENAQAKHAERFAE